MTETQEKAKSHFRAHWGFYSLLLISVIACSGLLISKNMALKRQAKAFTVEKTVLIEQAQGAMKANTEKHLEMMMRTFVWAVRGEMTRDNLEQVDQYFKQLVKSDNIREISLVNKTGTILISTNKKYEGNQLADGYDESLLKTEEVTIIDGDDVDIVAAPIMALDSRMGTVILQYKPDFFQLLQQADLTQDNK